MLKFMYFKPSRCLSVYPSRWHTYPSRWHTYPSRWQTYPSRWHTYPSMFHTYPSRYSRYMEPYMNVFNKTAHKASMCTKHQHVKTAKMQKQQLRNPRISVSAKQLLNSVFGEEGITVGLVSSQPDNLNLRRRFLEDSKLYLKTSMTIVEQNFDSDSFSQIVDFRRLIDHIGITDVTVKELLSSSKCQDEVSTAIVDGACTMKDEVFVDALLVLYRLKAEIKDTYLMETQCFQRLDRLPVNTMLLIADWWIASGRRAQRYHKEMMEVIQCSKYTLSTDHIVQLCHLISMYKYVPGSFFDNLLCQIDNHVEELSWSAITSVCTAIIKCRNRVDNSNKLMYKIGDYACQNMDNISNHDLTIILRSFSRQYFFHNDFNTMATRHLTERVNSMTMDMAAHNVFALSRFRILHQPLMDIIANKVVQSPHIGLRIKSVWMILRAFARLNYEPPEADAFFAKCVDLITQRRKQYAQYPFQFLRALTSLAYLNRYYQHLLAIIFDPTFLKRCVEASPAGIDKHLQLLNTCVEIDFPEYTGPKLPKNYCSRLHGATLQESSFHRDFKTEVNEVSHMLQNLLGGPEYAKLHCILNHFGYFAIVPDIEINLDQNGKPIPVTNEETTSPGTSKKLAVIVSAQSHHIQNGDKLHGSQAMKVRHLTKLGYTVVQIPSTEWNTKISSTERGEYLKAKLHLLCTEIFQSKSN